MEASHVVFDLGSTLIRTPPAAERHRRRLEYFRKLHGKLQSLGISAQFPLFSSLSESEFASGLTAHIFRLKGQVEDWHLKDSVLQFLHQWKDAHTGERTDILQVRNWAITIEDAVEDDSLLDVSGYEVLPDTISTLTSLKSSGKHISVYINTCHPPKYRKILQVTGLTPLLDFVFFSCEAQVQFPSREINTVVLNTLGICESALIYIGDMLDRTIKSAQLGGVKAIWVNFAPADEERNRKALESGLVAYPRAVHSLSLVENAIKFYSGDNAEMKIGYFLPRGKKRILMGHKRCFRSTNRLWYNAVDVYMDLEPQGQFSVLVHKTVDLLTVRSPEARLVLSRLREYIDRHKEVCVIDPMERLDVCADRKLFLSLVKQALERERVPWSIRIPWHYDLPVITANSHTEVIDNMRQASISFPVIVKTVTSANTPMSHLLFIVFDEVGLSAALSSYSESLIIQEYINHDAIVYKAYVFGEFEEIVPRESCGNLVSASDFHCVQFYSNEPWPDSLRTTEKPVVKPIEKSAFAYISALIQREFHLSLFGFDVLLPKSSSDLVLIDLNHFPGYKEIADLSELMDNLVLTLSSRYRLT